MVLLHCYQLWSQSFWLKMMKILKVASGIYNFYWEWLNSWLLNLEICFQAVFLYSYQMVAHTLVSNNCVTIMSLFQLYGCMLEWSRAPAAQMICVLLIAMCSSPSPHKMIFDAALASRTLNSRHYFMFYSSLFKVFFTVVLLFVVLQGGGRSKNVTLSVSCVPQMFISSLVQKEIEIRSVYVTKCLWGQVFKCNIVKLFLANCCPYSAV